MLTKIKYYNFIFKNRYAFQFLLILLNNNKLFIFNAFPFIYEINNLLKLGKYTNFAKIYYKLTFIYSYIY